MGMTDDDDTVYCEVQMPLAQGRELLQLVSTLRDSKAHPTLDRVSSACSTSSARRFDIVEILRLGAPGASKQFTLPRYARMIIPSTASRLII